MIRHAAEIELGGPRDGVGEFRKAGIVAALEAAGLSRYRVTFGDLGLFSALLEDTEMPARWRQRLREAICTSRFTAPAGGVEAA